jgi:hypothetical protein
MAMNLGDARRQANSVAELLGSGKGVCDILVVLFCLSATVVTWSAVLASGGEHHSIGGYVSLGWDSNLWWVSLLGSALMLYYCLALLLYFSALNNIWTASMPAYMKLIWALLVLALPMVGMLAYYFLRLRKSWFPNCPH